MINQTLYLLSEFAVTQLDVVLIMVQVLIVLQDFQVLIVGVANVHLICQPIRFERLLILDLIFGRRINALFFGVGRRAVVDEAGLRREAGELHRLLVFGLGLLHPGDVVGLVSKLFKFFEQISHVVLIIIDHA